jgi:hypothetical protein
LVGCFAERTRLRRVCTRAVAGIDLQRALWIEVEKKGKLKT